MSPSKRDEEAKVTSGDVVVAAVGAIAIGGALFLFTRGKNNLANLNGTVLSALDSTPIVGAAVVVGKTKATTIAGGKFTMKGLPIGKIGVGIAATGFIDYSASITLKAGDQAKTFAMAKTASQAAMTGTITSLDSGTPLAGVTVSIGGRFAQTAADGSYTITGLTTGPATASASLSGYKTVTESRALTTGSNTWNASMTNRGTIGGTVRDSVTSAPIAGAVIAASATVKVTTNQNGTYQLTMASSFTSVTITAAGYQTQTQPVSIQPGEAIPLNISMIQTFAEMGTIQGVVSNALNGNTISGAPVIFVGPDQIPHQVTSGFGGAYTIDLPSNSLPGITYSIEASFGGYQAYSSVITLRTGTIVTKNIPMAPIAVPPGTLAGIVLDQNLAPISGVAIRVVTNPGTTIVGTATTDANGYYQIGNIAPGNYTVWANKTGYAQASHDVTVISGQTVVVARFDLQSQGGAIGFRMQIDFDPSNWPTAAIWYANLNDRYFNYWISVNSMWDASQFDISGDVEQALYVSIFDSSLQMLAERYIPLGGPRGPLMQNGHVYSFNFDQATLYDMGLF